jgi:hypothetical protein
MITLGVSIAIAFELHYKHAGYKNGGYTGISFAFRDVLVVVKQFKSNLPNTRATSCIEC